MKKAMERHEAKNYCKNRHKVGSSRERCINYFQDDIQRDTS
jgi:hypothetical protein